MGHWGQLGEMLEVRLRTRSIPNEIRNLAREIRAEAEEDALINVIIPETVRIPGGATSCTPSTSSGSRRRWWPKPTWS